MKYSVSVLLPLRPPRWTKHTLSASLLPCLIHCGQGQVFAAPGYHKDLFIDCGPHLLCPSPHAAKHLGLHYEILRTKSSSEQNKHIVGHSQDENGVLLYPDGAPRYRLIYVNGGESKDHGKTLGAKGLARFRDFYLRGGSYTGSCAGAFIASSRRMGRDMKDLYFSIWPGETKETWYGSQASSWYIGPSAFKIEKESPLLNYNDFGKDLYVDEIKHYEGPYALEGEHWPKKTEVLARFDLPKAKFHNTPAVWAYRKDKSSGRMVVVASHPENYRSGERMDLMAAILSYALDGTAKPRLKALLEPGTSVSMSKNGSEQDPCLTKIGDSQLHHFAVKVPAKTKELSIQLSGEETLSTGEPAQLHLFAHNQGPAWPNEASHKSKKAGAKQSLSISDPSPGLWLVSVLGASKVSQNSETSATGYKKNLGALNGIAYKISVNFDEAKTELSTLSKADPWCDRFIHELEEVPDPEGSQDPSQSDTPDPSSSQDPSGPNPTPSSDESESTKSSQESEDSPTPSKQAPTEQDSKNQEDPDDQAPPGGCQLQPAPPSPFLLFSMLLYVKSRRRKSSPAIRRQTRPYPNA